MFACRLTNEFNLKVAQHRPSFESFFKSNPRDLELAVNLVLQTA